MITTIKNEGFEDVDKAKAATKKLSIVVLKKFSRQDRVRCFLLKTKLNKIKKNFIAWIVGEWIASDTHKSCRLSLAI